MHVQTNKTTLVAQVLEKYLKKSTHSTTLKVSKSSKSPNLLSSPTLSGYSTIGGVNIGSLQNPYSISDLKSDIRYDSRIGASTYYPSLSKSPERASISPQNLRGSIQSYGGIKSLPNNAISPTGSGTSSRFLPQSSGGFNPYFTSSPGHPPQHSSPRYSSPPPLLNAQSGDSLGSPIGDYKRESSSIGGMYHGYEQAMVK